MNIYLNENIKRLRKEKDITQDTLADFLGVSFQSVSKWERSEAFPDITLLPAIANYFGVTIDELMGNDKILNEEKIQKDFAKYDELFCIDSPQSNKEKNILAKALYKSYPHDWRVINLYRHSLVCGHDGTVDDIRDETRRLCELILDKCTVEKYRIGAVYALLYISESEEEAEKWLDLLPVLANQITVSQEYNKVDHYVKYGKYDKARLQQQINFFNYYENIMQAMTDICNFHHNMPSPEPSYVIAMQKKQIALTNIIFEKGEKPCILGACHLRIAQEYLKMNDTENAHTHLDEAVAHYIKYDTLPKEFPYTSLGFERMMYKEHEHLNEWYSIEFFLQMLENDTRYDRLRGDERFKKIIELLKAHKPIKKYFRLEQ